MDFLGGSVVKNLPANAGAGSVPGLGRSPREKKNGNPLYYYCLGNPMDKRAWHATVHRVSGVRHDLETKQQHYIVFFFM